MNKTVLFRVNWNKKSGLGHLYRVIAIAEMIKSKFSFKVITTYKSNLDLLPKNYLIDVIPKNIKINNEPNWIYNKYHYNYHILLLDGYIFNSDYQKQIKKNNFKLILVDDLVSGNYYADLIINHTNGIKEIEYTSKKYTKFALGSKFALLRPSFISLAKEPKKKFEKISEVFLNFGGSDIHNLSFKFANKLSEIDTINKVNLVLGGEVNKNNIFPNNNKIVVYNNLNENQIISIFRKCQLAIVPNSTILYEVLCSNMYIISGYYSSNQFRSYQYLKSNNIIFGLDDLIEFNINNLNKIVKSLTSKKILNQNKKKYLFIDGFQQKRILNLLKKL